MSCGQKHTVVYFVELPVPWKNVIEMAYERKKLRYTVQSWQQRQRSVVEKF